MNAKKLTVPRGPSRSGNRHGLYTFGSAPNIGIDVRISFFHDNGRVPTTEGANPNKLGFSTYNCSALALVVITENGSPVNRSFSTGVPRGCLNRIRLWLLRRDDQSGVLIGAVGQQRCD